MPASHMNSLKTQRMLIYLCSAILHWYLQDQSLSNFNKCNQFISWLILLGPTSKYRLVIFNTVNSLASGLDVEIIVSYLMKGIYVILRTSSRLLRCCKEFKLSVFSDKDKNYVRDLNSCLEQNICLESLIFLFSFSLLTLESW